MDKKRIAKKLKSILNKADVDSDGLINRKISSKHEDEIEVLLEHLSLLVADALFVAASSRKELFQVRSLLE